MGRLNAGFIRTVKKPGSYGDGHGGYGLTLLVRPRAAGGVRKSWSQRIRIGGKVTNIGLGPYPVVGLAEARKRALANRRMIEQGHDPRRGRTPTFAEAAEKVIQLHRAGWKPGASTEGRWRSSISKHAVPVIGDKPVDQITTADLLAVLAPIWSTKPAVARFLRQRIGAVMRWCIAQGYRADNPAGETLTAALPKQNGNTEHQKALPHAEVGAALGKLRLSGAHPTAVLAFEFQVLTAVRPSEARLARRDEIDLEGRVWTLPPERMKTKREHRVPLSTRALQVLDEAHQYADGSGLVFSGRNGPISRRVFSDMLRRVGIDAVPHGFRSSFRDWCGETGVPRELAEAALGHTVRGVEGAYARSDLLERRREVMDDWGKYLVR